MKNIRIMMIVAAAVVSALGTMLHFAYENLGGIFWAVIGAVNESTWEHLKLIFWPSFVVGIIEYIVYGRGYKGFISVKVISIFIGMAAIVVLFYTYTGVLGFNIAAVDIGIFFISVLLSYVFMYWSLIKSKNERFSTFCDICFAEATIAVALLFIIFTFNAPSIAVFRDPTDGSIGL